MVTSIVLTTPSSLTLCTVKLPVLTTTSSENVMTKSELKLTSVVLSAGLIVLTVGAMLSSKYSLSLVSVGRVLVKAFPARSVIFWPAAKFRVTTPFREAIFPPETVTS